MGEGGPGGGGVSFLWTPVRNRRDRDRGLGAELYIFDTPARNRLELDTDLSGEPVSSRGEGRGAADQDRVVVSTGRPIRRVKALGRRLEVISRGLGSAQETGRIDPLRCGILPI